jgi:riboflavin synthase
MFTGIVTHRGEVCGLEKEEGRDMSLSLASDDGFFEEVALGGSVSCSGVCLTLKGRGSGGEGLFGVSGETLKRTTLGDWRVGTGVNLERSLCLGDELGGHMVQGHVDGVVILREMRADGGSYGYRFEVLGGLERYVARKGSVALDGVSLTVNEVEEDEDGRTYFWVNVIEYTYEHTTFSGRKAGDGLNMEVDMMMRYLERLREKVDG